METKKNKGPKTVASRYVVKVNEQPVQTFDSLKDARAYIGSMVVNEGVEGVSIVRETVTETLINSFTPKTTTILTADSLGFDDEGDFANEN